MMKMLMLTTLERWLIKSILTKLMLTKLMLTTMERWLTKWLLVTG